MNAFSPQSLEQLNTCHPDLIKLCNAVLPLHDFKVNEGHRNKAAQDMAIAAGKSKTPWPTSKHNAQPSNAVDLLPFINGHFIGWNAPLEQWALFAGMMLATAKQLGIAIRWGGNWSGDNDLATNKFDDLPHFELLKE